MGNGEFSLMLAFRTGPFFKVQFVVDYTRFTAIDLVFCNLDYNWLLSADYTEGI